MAPLSHRASRPLLALAVAAALTPLESPAARLGTNGLGQALIFPYYTVRAAEGGNAFNTYVSVVNTTPQAKAVRVRVREGRAGHEVLSFNLFLSPNDVWSAAMVPTDQGTQLLTVDSSCTDPTFQDLGSPLRGAQLNNFGFSGAQADGLGATLDRTREGYVEMIELATLTGASAAAATHNSAGIPMNCAAIRAPTVPTVAAPTGGLAGTLTLINVNSGMDFTLDATALAELSTQPFYRPPADPYPDFNAAEIDPVSVVVHGNRVYRSVWSRPLDAVSAVLMRSEWIAEYVLDNPTASLTDVVVALPTRRLHLAPQPTAPFVPISPPPASQAHYIEVNFFNREERGAQATTDLGPGIPPRSGPVLESAAGVASPYNAAAHVGAASTLQRTAVFGSTTRGLWGGQIPLAPGFQNGWLRMVPSGTGASDPAMVSLPQSTVFDLATGTSSTGAQTYRGLPVIGFSARTFRNGTLSCTGAGSCQGNYGGAFPMKYRRSISP